ncbi:MAG: cation:proton antiporter subunit C [Actinomycetota bacterium]|nr:cation:proton antiporter subunit C [Actinomycetota bacterium]
MSTGNFLYGVAMLLFLIGFYTVLARPSLIKKIIGINIMETSVFLFLISVGSRRGGSAPIILSGVKDYVNPLPQVVVLMAMVIAVGTTALALSMAVKIFESSGAGERRG